VFPRDPKVGPSDRRHHIASTHTSMSGVQASFQNVSFTANGGDVSITIQAASASTASASNRSGARRRRNELEPWLDVTDRSGSGSGSSSNGAWQHDGDRGKPIFWDGNVCVSTAP
jgi:hypothetical protein